MMKLSGQILWNVEAPRYTYSTQGEKHSKFLLYSLLSFLVIEEIRYSDISNGYVKYVLLIP